MVENSSLDDFSSYQVFLDVWALEAYIQILEVELPRVIGEERKRIWQDVKPGDEQQEHYAEIAEYQLDEGITIRLLTGTALIATWATYESVVRRSAKRIQSRRLQLKIRRGPFPESARTYFEDVLKCDLHPQGTDWDRLNVSNATTLLRQLRCSLSAHRESIASPWSAAHRRRSSGRASPSPHYMRRSRACEMGGMAARQTGCFGPGAHI